MSKDIYPFILFLQGPPFAKNKDPHDAGVGESAYFLGVNRNKKSITVNFKNAEGVDIIKRLAAKSDVVVENFVPVCVAVIC